MECPPVLDAPFPAEAAREAKDERGPSASPGRSMFRLLLIFV